MTNMAVPAAYSRLFLHAKAILLGKFGQQEGIRNTFLLDHYIRPPPAYTPLENDGEGRHRIRLRVV